MFLQQQKNVWLIFTWIWELQTYNSPFTHVIMQHGWQDAASEVVSLVEQFSESSYKIIKPAFKQESKEKRLWTSWTISGPGRSSLLRDGLLSVNVSVRVWIWNDATVHVCVLQGRNTNMRQTNCSIKQRALNTTNTFQSYCLYSSYNSVIIVIAGDDELMLLYHHCCNSLLNPGVESTLPAHTHTCFLTNSASSVRFLIHSSLYGVKQTNFLPLSVLVLQFLPLHFCTANASSSSLLWLRGLRTACYMSGKLTLSVFTVFLQLHLFPLLPHQTEFSKVCEHTAKVGEGPLLRSNTVLVMVTNEWVSACRADRQKPFNWPIGPPSKCSVQPRRVKQGMWIIKH